MKHIYFLTLLFLSPLYSLLAQQVQLTFRVDMRNQTVAAGGVHVAGNFQAAAGFGGDWNPGATRLTDPDNVNIFEATVTVPAGIYQYKFVNGNSWQGGEQVPSDCSINDGGGNYNRIVNVTATAGTPVYRFGTCETTGATAPATDYATHWWNDAVFYEVFVRSFYDSNGDGKGDFRGLIEKLDYLNDGDPNTTTDLGITGIWLMPMMESSSYHGYDVTDYYATEPDYGTMADFEAFLAAAHQRGIKVIIDFVMNHSSDQHPWFTQSASSSSTNQYRDWYVWSATNPGYKGPWGQDVWHQRNGSYFYGLFWGGMPDLNWSNPQLKNNMWDITRFWLNKGVDGYRIDAVKYLDEDGTKMENTPETFAILQEFNQVVKAAKPSAFTVGEVWSGTPSVVPYVQNNRLDSSFEFDLSYAILNSVRSNNPSQLRGQLNLVNQLYPQLQYSTFLTNHDQPRVLNELSSNQAHMKQAAALYLTMPGVPFLYYGEEVGMLSVGSADEDKRRPMQWTPGTQAGFTTGTPWRSINSNYSQFNVQTMAGDANSLLSHYRKLIHIRNGQQALRKGYYLAMDAANTAVLSYARVFEQEAVVVVSNFGSSAVTSPNVSMAVSTLPAGTYSVTELYGDQAMGTVTVNAQGGFSNWAPAGASLGADQTWILRLAAASPTGIAGTEEALTVKLYPNPVAGSMQLELQEARGQQRLICIYDLTGKLLYKSSFAGNSHTLDTTTWVNGVYFIKIETGNQQTMQRLVVTH